MTDTLCKSCTGPFQTSLKLLREILQHCAVFYFKMSHLVHLQLMFGVVVHLHFFLKNEAIFWCYGAGF